MSSLAKWWPKVQRNPVSGCWLHPGAPGNRAGHVHVVYRGQRLYAHRLIYILTHGPAQAGEVIRHTCDDPACVNPDHLIIGTQRDNVHDCIRRNRRPWVKLKADDIVAIRARGAAGETQPSIAKSFGITQQTVSKIVHRRAWSHVAEEHGVTLQPTHQNRNCNFVAEVIR